MLVNLDYERWFFGLKIHLVINNFGELIAFKMTKANVNDGTGARI